MAYDLEDQQEKEQFTEESTSTPSKDVLKYMKEQKRFEKHNLIKQKTAKTKEKAVFTRIENQNHYICYACGQPFKEEDISLMYGSYGERAYCHECAKKHYPNYKPIRLFTTMSKTDFMSNHADTKYNKGFK